MFLTECLRTGKRNSFTRQANLSSSRLMPFNLTHICMHSVHLQHYSAPSSKAGVHGDYLCLMGRHSQRRPLSWEKPYVSIELELFYLGSGYRLITHFRRSRQADNPLPKVSPYQQTKWNYRVASNLSESSFMLNNCVACFGVTEFFTESTVRLINVIYASMVDMPQTTCSIVKAHRRSIVQL